MIADMAALRALCRSLPGPDAAAAAAVRARQGQLTKPPGSLGRLEELAAWLAAWQRRPMPRLERVEVVVFAGSHGVTGRGVSPYPASVTGQMVANFAAGGAAINQLARVAGASLAVHALEVERPTRDLVDGPAMEADEFVAAVRSGFDAVRAGTDLLALGEMGIGNTTAAAAIVSALTGKEPELVVGRGTGVDAAGLARKIAVVRDAINQLAACAGATLRVVPLALDAPTADFTGAPAMTEAAFLDAVAAGMQAVPEDCDLLCLGEMGIGNTTAAAALCAGLFGAGDWVGRGTGVDTSGIARKRTAVAAGLARHAAVLNDPLRVACALGGRELAAILGAVLAARSAGVPVLLDGFVCTAAAAPLACLASDALAHCCLAHLSVEPGHSLLAQRLGLRPLLALDMRLGEASGAALAVPLLRAALACHNGMATFAEADVSGSSGATGLPLPR